MVTHPAHGEGSNASHAPDPGYHGSHTSQNTSGLNEEEYRSAYSDSNRQYNTVGSNRSKPVHISSLKPLHSQADHWAWYWYSPHLLSITPCPIFWGVFRGLIPRFYLILFSSTKGRKMNTKVGLHTHHLFPPTYPPDHPPHKLLSHIQKA